MRIVVRLAPLVVIGDDQFHAAAGEGFGLVNCSDAAIDADNQLGAVFDELSQRFGVEAVAFFQSLGNVVVHIAAQQRDGVPENRGGGDAIDVVIAVDHNFFAIAYG